MRVDGCSTQHSSLADQAGVTPVQEQLPNSHEWLRVADPQWDDPLDPTYAAATGGRWNPPASYPTLYLNEDIVTARVNMLLWTDQWPYAPEDLRPEHAPVLVTATLPRDQIAADAHTPSGLEGLGLPPSYPIDDHNARVSHDRCQPIGEAVRNLGLQGIRCRSAQTPLGAGRELAWFPRTARSEATLQHTQAFDEWFWS